MGAPETGKLKTSGRNVGRDAGAVKDVGSVKDADLVVVEAEIDRLIESAFANQAYLSRITSRAEAPPADVPLVEMPPLAPVPAAHVQEREAAAPAVERKVRGRPATGLVLAAILVAVAGLAYFVYQPSSVRPNPPPNPPLEARVVNAPAAQAAGGPITHLPPSEPPAAAAAPAITQVAAPPSPRPQAKRSPASAVVPVAAPEPSAPVAGSPGRTVVTHTKPASAGVPAEVKAAPAVVQSSPAQSNPAREPVQGPACSQEMAALGFCVANATAEAK